MVALGNEGKREESGGNTFLNTTQTVEKAKVELVIVLLLP